MEQRFSDSTSIRQLLKEDRKLWEQFHHEQVSDRAEEMCCGWKPIHPSATYNLVKPRRKKAGTTLYTASTTSVVNESDSRYPYMNGELDENYSYVYRGGLSNRAYSSTATEFNNAMTTRPSPQPHRHVQTVTLDHMHANYASANALANCRDELSRVLALQLKPELLVEQLIIENRLRTMSLAAFPVLQGKDSDSQSRMNDSKVYSHSTPALLPNTHVNYHRPPRHRHTNKGRRERAHSHKPTARPDAKPPPMQWCKSLTSHKTCSNHQQNGLEIVPSSTTSKPSLHHQTLHLHNHSSPTVTNSSRSSYHTSSHPYTSSTQAITNTTPDPNHHHTPQYRLPVVAPTIPSLTHTSGGNNNHSKHMHTLLYNPPSRPNEASTASNSGKSSSVKTGSSFYYPQVSYYNSKPLNFK